MKGRTQLERQAASLIDDFRSRHYPLSIILVDRDSDPCVTATVEGFDRETVTAARAPVAQRNVLICVAVAELESWYLADEEAIRRLMPDVAYSSSAGDRIGRRRIQAPQPVARVGPRGLSRRRQD